MKKQYRLIKGYARLTKNELKEFKKLDTVIVRDPVEIAIFDDIDSAKKALDKYKSSYCWYNEYIFEIEEYAIEEYTVDDEGEFFAGSDYYPAAVDIDEL